MREFWMEWRRSGNARTRQGNLKQPTRQNALNWVSAAWKSVAEGIVVHSFLCCGISNSLDGSEDCHIHDRIPTVDDDSEGDGEGEEEDQEVVDGLEVLDEEEEAMVEKQQWKGKRRWRRQQWKGKRLWRRCQRRNNCDQFYFFSFDCFAFSLFTLLKPLSADALVPRANYRAVWKLGCRVQTNEDFYRVSAHPSILVAECLSAHGRCIGTLR